MPNTPFPHLNHDVVPLFVDLDGTLIKTDLSVESALYCLKKQPWLLLMMVYWLLAFGKARLKEELAQRTVLNVDTLPLQEDFLAFLRNEAKHGRFLCLATASNRRLAEPLANHLEIFSYVLASDAQHNLKGERKLAAIFERCHGETFDYAGNSRADLAIWAKARQAIVVNPETGVLAAARTRNNQVRLFDDRPAATKTWLQALRLQQWAKNVLLGVPVLTAHAFNIHAFLATIAAFIAFGLIASAAYLLNDLLDLSADRQHPRKRTRPFAAGDAKLTTGIWLLFALFALGFTIAAQLADYFVLTLLAYLLLTLSYSFYFKKIVLLDVLLLAALYTLRIIAGTAAIEVTLSSWLLGFSLFVFLSLALVKRYTELKNLQEGSRDRLGGGDYLITDYAVLSMMGIAAAYSSVMVLALFVNSPESLQQYSYPALLWLLCPLMVYWLSRLWLKTARGEMHDDPLIYSLKDSASWIVFVSMMVITLVAI